MTTVPSQIYPAVCFSASPTYNVWVKLTAADVHALRAQPGFEGQNVYFHLNHPIRYVRIVGTVVVIDDIAPTITLLTLDDGSGATIDVKITRLSKDIVEKQAIECASNTAVDNVNVNSGIGTFGVEVDGQALSIGITVKAKCTISEFRMSKQLDLKRISIVRDTDEEVRAWQELAGFRDEVLSKPWTLSDEMVQQLKEEAANQRRKEKERERRKAVVAARKAEHRKAHEAERAARRRAREEKYERRRRKEEIMYNAGALDRQMR